MTFENDTLATLKVQINNIESQIGFGVNVTSISDGAIAVADFNGGVFQSISDSVWEDRIAEHKKDSVFGGAFGYVPAGTRAFAVTDFDSAQGTIANSQVADDVVVSATATVSAANMGLIADSVWGVAYTGGTSNIGAVAGSIGDSLNNPFGVNVKWVASATIEDQDINTIGVNVESVTDGAIVAADSRSPHGRPGVCRGCATACRCS